MAHNIIEKIQGCSVQLSRLVSQCFGSFKKKKKLTSRLAELQKMELTEVVHEELTKVEASLDVVLRDEETMWFQRSRALWLKDGDRNSHFYH